MTMKKIDKLSTRKYEDWLDCKECYSAKLSLKSPSSSCSGCNETGAGGGGRRPMIGPDWLTPGYLYRRFGTASKLALLRLALVEDGRAGSGDAVLSGGKASDSA